MIETFIMSALAAASVNQALAGPQAPVEQPATSAPGAAASDVGISDIIVTAQRRAENVQRTSVPISVISSADLVRKGVTDAKDLNGLVPGVSLADRGLTTQVNIRGVGITAANGLESPAVATNIDGIYIDRPPAVGTNFYDLERVEILKGPQGTLYGRGATGGALNLITVAPKLDVVTGYFSADIGNYSQRIFEGAVNVPIGDTVAIRASGKSARRSGFLSDGTSDLNMDAGRLQLLWKPSEDFSLRLMGDIAHRGGVGEGAVLLPRPAGAGKFTGISDPISIAAQQAASAAFFAATGAPPFFAQANIPPAKDGYVDLNTRNIGAEINANLGFATLTVLPAYRYLKFENLTYSPGFYTKDNEAAKQTTVEVRLANQDHRLKWTLGFYYFNLDNTLDYFADGNSILVEYFTPAAFTSRSYAGFASGSYSVTDRFRLIGGVRYTTEHRTIDGSFFNLPGSQPGTLPGPGAILIANYAGSKTFNSTNFRAGLEYDVAPQSMFYVTASSGFKAGGFYTSPAPNSFEPETLTAYEVGLKNRFFGNRLQLNVGAFYWDYKNLQQSFVGYDSAANIAQVTVNAGKARLYGFDADVLGRVTSADTLRATLLYNHTRFTSFVYETAAGQARSGVTTECSVGPVHPLTANPALPAQTVNCSGYPLARAPQWSGTVGYQHVFTLNSGATIQFDADATWSSGYWLDVDFTPQERAKGYVVGSANLEFSPDGGRWSLAAYVKNITDHQVYTGSKGYPLAIQVSTASVNPPRQYGVKFGYRF